MTPEVIESTGDSTLNNNQLTVVTQLDDAVQLLAQKEEEFAEYLNELDRRKKEIDTLKGSLYEMMTNEEVKKVESEHLIITLVRPTTRHTYDMKKLEAINPALYSQVDTLVGKDSDVKGYVKLTPRTR